MISFLVGGVGREGFFYLVLKALIPQTSLFKTP